LAFNLHTSEHVINLFVCDKLRQTRGNQIPFIVSDRLSRHNRSLCTQNEWFTTVDVQQSISSFNCGYCEHDTLWAVWLHSCGVSSSVFPLELLELESTDDINYFVINASNTLIRSHCNTRYCNCNKPFDLLIIRST